MKRNGWLLTPVVLFFLTACGGGGGKKAPDADGDGTADAVDCAAQLATAWQLLNFASSDDDGDGFRVNANGQVCAGVALPSNRSATAVTGDSVDCDDTNATRWATRSYAAVDSDQDGYGAAQSGQLCAGTALPAGLIATLPAPKDLDCDDANAVRWRIMAFYRDADRDGVGAGPASRACIGTVAPDGYALTGYDPVDDPQDPLALTISTFDLDSALLTPSEELEEDDVF